MSNTAIFWIILTIHLVLFWFLNYKYNLLRGANVDGGKAPFSYSKVQMAWWSIIVLSSFIAITFSYCHLPTLDTSTLILLGISAGTTVTARAIDVSEKGSDGANTASKLKSDGLLIDILSDNNNINMHRLQSVIFNITFGIYFINSVIVNLAAKLPLEKINTIMPPIDNNNLILLGLSSATYAALKATENKDK